MWESVTHSLSCPPRAAHTCQGKFDVTKSKSFHPLPLSSPSSCCKERVTEDWQLKVTVCECLGQVSESCGECCWTPWCERMKVSSTSLPCNRSPLANVHRRRMTPACCGETPRSPDQPTLICSVLIKWMWSLCSRPNSQQDEISWLTKVTPSKERTCEEEKRNLKEKTQMRSLRWLFEDINKRVKMSKMIQMIFSEYYCRFYHKWFIRVSS